MADESIWICASCGHENFAPSRFCEVCGKSSATVPQGPRPPLYSRDSGRDDRPRQKVRMRFLHMSERLKGALTRDNYREVIDDRSNPVTTMLIAFVAWGIFRLVGFAPLMILLRFLTFLMGPFGLVLTLAVAYTYSRHRAEIDARVGTLRRRARAFRRAAGHAVNSVSWMRRRLRAFSESEEKSPPTKGDASVRVLDEDWEEEGE